jgi:hypothetical protein
MAIAKCGSKTFTLSGTVVMPDGRPAAGALVGAAWKEDGLIGGPALSKTDANGRYSISITFHTYSSTPSKSWYECAGKLEQVAVSAYSDSLYAPPVPVQVREGIFQIDATPLELSFDILSGAPIKVGG